MSVSQYVIGGTALVAALAIGYAKWTERGAEAKTSKAETAIAKADCAVDLADDVTQSALQQVATLTAEVQRQKAIAAAEAKKSQDRLRENNELRRKIANVPNDENVPVPSALEHVLDAARVRGAAPRDGAAEGADKDADDGSANTSGGNTVPAAASPAS